MRSHVHNVLIAALLIGLCGSAAQAVTGGFVDTFAAPGTAGWGGSTGVTNPGTGGVGGAGDGFLRVANIFAGNFGTMNTGANYTGDWQAAGIASVSFFLSDVDTDQSYSFRLLLSSPGGSSGTTFQHNVGIDPPAGQWQQYTVSLDTPADWTRIRGDLSFEGVLQNVGTVHFRHDLAPYSEFPDPILGNLGIDSIALVVPEPSAFGIAALLGTSLLRRGTGRRPLFHRGQRLR